RMQCTARLTADVIDDGLELETFRASAQACGAIVTFAGIARGSSKTGETVTGLFLDHHPRMTAGSLENIAADAGERFGVEAIHVVHRCGKIAPGETIVLVATAALHRRAAFEAAEYAMDRLKTEAVLWKREDGLDGSRWVE